MAKLDLVEKLSMELAQVIAGEERALQQVEEYRRKRAKLRRELQEAAAGGKVPESKEQPRRQVGRRRGAQRAVSTHTVTGLPAATGQPETAKPARPSGQPDSEKVRAYVASITDGEITPERVASATGVKSSLVATYLGRLTGTLLVRVPGTKRGRYLRITPKSGGAVA